ncbi:hypothetical protein H7H48_18075 [Nitratireductor sp. B36]|uniref:hypothetical protein n=1 Tax=Nitratireductor sp. B36 TaxID=2762059 RepID=UPI001E492204|nr:hypothetical protein [Nitratireductor sp. B36]MCC5780977.1 hypothetical protein [Nitratireductor sp. B36]
MTDNKKIEQQKSDYKSQHVFTPDIRSFFDDLDIQTCFAAPILIQANPVVVLKFEPENAAFSLAGIF